MKTASRRYTHSSSFKMAALFALLLGASALMMGYFLYDFSRQNFIRETEAAIDNEMERIVALVGQKDAGTIARYIGQQSALAEHTAYLYRTASNERIAGNMASVPDNTQRIREGIVRFTLDWEGEERIFAAKIHTFQDGTQLLIARDIHAIVQSYERLKLFSGIIMFFMLIVVLASFFISTFVVSRINVIADTAREIMETGDLSRRISIETQWDDLSNLAQILNAMLAHTEESMQAVRDVTDNIAHDLRTPLTHLRNRLEALKQKPDAQTAEALLQDADGILATFSALLRIANIEKGKWQQAFAPVSLQTILQDVIELYEPLAEKNNLTIRKNITTGGDISGDGNLLFQLFANLLDNAIKFSPEGGIITISLGWDNGRCTVICEDTGCGIPKDEREKVFRRFYRADKSRSTAGNGLGLSLVQAVVRLHKGQITLEDNSPGLRVSVVL